MSIVTPFPAQLGSGIKMADSIIRYLQGLNLLLDTATLARLTGDSLDEHKREIHSRTLARTRTASP